MNATSFSSASIASALESTARRLARPVSVVITLAIMTYAAGHALGSAVHGTNDTLAAAVSGRPIVATLIAPSPSPIAPPAPLLPAVETKPAIAKAVVTPDQFEGVRVVDLRARCRAAGIPGASRLNRAACIEALS